MTVQAPLDATRQINKSAKAVSELGFEIVDIDGFLGLVETHAVQQHEALQALSSNVDKMTYANRDATVLAQGLRATSAKAR
jgi:methyl-accepting chemotaxis protein